MECNAATKKKYINISGIFTHMITPDDASANCIKSYVDGDILILLFSRYS